MGAPRTHQTCHLRRTETGARLELRLYGFRVHTFDFESVTDAVRWADSWPPAIVMPEYEVL